MYEQTSVKSLNKIVQSLSFFKKVGILCFPNRLNTLVISLFVQKLEAPETPIHGPEKNSEANPF